MNLKFSLGWLLLVVLLELSCEGMKYDFQAVDTFVTKNQSLHGASKSSITVQANCVDGIASPDLKLTYAVFHYEDSWRLNHDHFSKNEECCDKDYGDFKCHHGLLVKGIENSTVQVDSSLCSDGGVNEKFDGIEKSGRWIALVISCEGETFEGNFVFKGPFGYISSDYYSLLMFHGIMAVVYLAIAILWFTLMSCYWHDILKLQYWISAVLVLGMIEMAFAYGWYEGANKTGHSSKPLLGFAIFILVVKYSVSRILVLVVSMGYGVVKPSLGSTMYQVVAFGVVYFLTAIVYYESFYMGHAMNLEINHSQEALMNSMYFWAAFPLAFLDTVVITWILNSLYSTAAQLKLRNQIVKYNMYKSFFFVLIFAILVAMASIGYTLYYEIQRTPDSAIACFDTIIMKLIFFFILLSIMFLWRPNNNNQRFAYSALDTLDEDDDYESGPVAYASGMTRRNVRSMDDDDDIDWIDENIQGDEFEGSMSNTLFGLDEDEDELFQVEMSKLD